MTAADQRPNFRAPAPGGTAQLAGRAVARIGFGAMQLEHRAVGRDAALAILRLAVRAGVNHIDTAQFYGACTAGRLPAGADQAGQAQPAGEPKRIRFPSGSLCEPSRIL